MKNIIYILPAVFAMAFLGTLIAGIVQKEEDLIAMSMILGILFLFVGIAAGNMSGGEGEK